MVIRKLIGILHYKFISSAHQLVLQMGFEQKYVSF